MSSLRTIRHAAPSTRPGVAGIGSAGRVRDRGGARAATGLLIVNADDWGSEPYKTDAIHAAFAARGITSATAMVYMEDSDRAAAIAAHEHLALGLHLNLTMGFTDPRTPPAVVARQAALLDRFADPRLRRRTIDPRLHAAVRAAVADQVERFHALYGRDPDHIDGHEHVHLCLDVLAALPRGARTRPAISRRHSVPVAARPVRAARHRLLARRLLMPARAYDVRDLVPALGGGGLDRVLAPSGRAPIEIVCHPHRDNEGAVLVSGAWHDALAGCMLGSYADLAHA